MRQTALPARQPFRFFIKSMLILMALLGSSEAIADGWNVPFYPEGLSGGGVDHLIMFKDQIVAAGTFAWADDNIVATAVVAWNGSDWRPLGSLKGSVTRLSADSTTLYVSGSLDLGKGPGTVLAAGWNGTEWSDLTAGELNPVRVLGKFRGRLFGDKSGFLASYDQGKWSILDSSFTIQGAPRITSDRICAGGSTRAADGSILRGIACYDTTWSFIPDPARGVITVTFREPVRAGNEVLVLRAYTNLSPVTYSLARVDSSGISNAWPEANRPPSYLTLIDLMEFESKAYLLAATGKDLLLFRWNGKGMDTLEIFPPPKGGSALHLLMPAKDRIILSGDFQGIGNLRSQGVAEFEGGTWKSLSSRPKSGPDQYPTLLKAAGNRLFMGSEGMNFAGHAPASGVAAWDGTRWENMSGGIVMGLRSSTYNQNCRCQNTEWKKVSDVLAIGSDFYAAGDFDSTASGLASPGLAHWDGQKWNGMGLPPGSTVNAISYWKNRLYARGNIPKADGSGYMNLPNWSGSEWKETTPAAPAFIDQMSVFQDKLYVIRPSNDSYSDSILVFDGNAWKDCKNPLDYHSRTRKMLTYSGKLYLAGRFIGNMGTSLVRTGLMGWDGTTWSYPAPEWDVTDMATDGRYLYALAFDIQYDNRDEGVILQWDGANLKVFAELKGTLPFARSLRAIESFGGYLYVTGGNLPIKDGKPASTLIRFPLEKDNGIRVRKKSYESWFPVFSQAPNEEFYGLDALGKRVRKKSPDHIASQRYFRESQSPAQ
jgi:hypothetical protein